MMSDLVLSDIKGNIFVHPGLKMAASDGRSFIVPRRDEMVALPGGSTLFFMPHHAVVAWDETDSAYVTVKKFQDLECFPVSAFLIPGFTRTYLPAAQKTKTRLALPLWPYTAVGWRQGRFYACALQIDPARRQRPFYYEQRSLMRANISRVLKKFPKNRLFKHLSGCALFYNCRNAQDLYLNRGEAPLPVSPQCNARCFGCLSSQESDCSLASHERISFVPTAREVFEVALYHVKGTKQALVSFGQGCEGEPLLQFSVLKEAISLLRKYTSKGTIHLNTNGFNPAYLERLANAGLDSVRVSLNSVRERSYENYYRPRGYRLRDVLDSVRRAKKSGLFVSMNLLVLPGFTDAESEAGSLLKFLKKGFVDLLQLRNLSVDPDLFRTRVPYPNDKPMGIVKMVSLLKKDCAAVRLGYFNLPKEKFVL
jgi:pyruvate-formate lyase-activating enzyme